MYRPVFVKARRLNLFDPAIAARIISSAKCKAARRLSARGKSTLVGTGIVLNASSWGSSESNSFLNSRRLVSSLV